MKQLTTIRHWLPIITFCPVNKLPDLLYVSVTYSGDEVPELYELRKRITKAIRFKCMFMEDIAHLLYGELNASNLQQITVRLAFSRHVVIINRYES